MHAPLFLLVILEFMDKVDKNFFQAIIVIVEINISKAEIKGIAQIGVKI